MDTLFLEIVKASPVLGLMLIIWYFQRKDTSKITDNYKELVGNIQIESKNRETKMQETIDKNQEIIKNNQNIIQELAQKLNVVEIVKKDVEDIKDFLRK